MGPITAVIPFPRRVRLGEKVYRVGELRLIDLAEIQSYLDELTPDVVSDVLPKLDGIEDEDERRNLLSDAYESIEDGPPTIWDEQGTRWLLTIGGMATFLMIALRRWNPIDATECVQIAQEATWHQFLALRRAAFGSKPLKILERLLGLSDDSPHGLQTTWPEVIAGVAHAYGTADLTVIYERTLTELSALRTLGKPAELQEGVPVEEDDPDKLLARAAEQHKRFYGRYPTPQDPEAN